MVKTLKNIRKIIATLILWLMSFNIFGANLELDNKVNQNAFLDTAPNGVPLVNISTPSSKGVSVNTFKEFNVETKGLEILNNTGTGRGHLSGLVVSNPNLTVGKEAKTVVFQVNGNNRSAIEGYISALSPHKINLFIANENGIYANGGGFINVDRAVLTTGKVNLKNGDVVSFTVNDGNIEIGEKGLDVSNVNRVDLISRTQELIGKIVADKELNIVLGQNEVDLQGLVTKTTTSTNKPALSLNGGALGSMYSNGQINIISTEDGVGVNLKSNVVTEEDLRLKLAGNLIQNEMASKNIEIEAKDINNNKILANNLNILADNLQNNKSIVADSTKITTKENLINNDIISGDNVELNSKNVLNNNGSVIFATNNLKINAKDTITNERAEILSQGDIVLKADKIDNKVAKIKGLGIVDVTSRELNNIGEVKDLDRYALFWETWDARRINSYGEVLDKWGNGKLYDGDPDDPSDKEHVILDLASRHGAKNGYSYLFREKLDDIKAIM